MAISATHWQILCHLKDNGLLPQGGRILEIGEANWYGDCDPAEVFARAGEACDPADSFAVAKLVYKAAFASIVVDAIDLDPTRNAFKFDLNEPITAEQLNAHQRYDVAFNHGTAEHVFNIAQAFRTMHDATKMGGLLIHESPFTGWVDHGFYCLQPTLFWDVAAANDYKIEFAAIEHMASQTWHEITAREQLLEMKRQDQLADNLMLFVVMRKQLPQEFKIPMQGVYSGKAGHAAAVAWRSLR